MIVKMRLWMSVACVFLTIVCLTCGENDNSAHRDSDSSNSDLEQQLRVLSKQVTTLLDRRREDLQIIEDNMRRKLSLNPELVDVKEEMKNLRDEMAQLRSSGRLHNKGAHHQQVHRTQEQNEHLTLKWLSNTVTELKTELSEIQTTLNSTVIIQNHEQVDSELGLLKTDVANLNRELEIARSRNAKYEAEILEMREEMGALRDHFKATAVICGKTKNQLKAAQLEWNYNWKTLNDKKSPADLQLDEKPQGHNSRHQRLLKKHIIDLERYNKHLTHSNEELQTKILKLQEEMRLLQNYVQEQTNHDEKFDRISGNEINDYIRTHRITEIKPGCGDLEEKVANLSEQQKTNVESIFNLTRQMSNFDKLHLSMLELLENVESIENTVDKSFPEFRKEISKLEVQASVTASEMAMIKEDHENTRKSLKAIGVGVSNLQDKTEVWHREVKDLTEVVDNLKKSSSLQTSKLHDHILKAESSTIDLNSTKSTIHLVQELKSFENEYKSIVNKLPHDCNSVSGANGIYLISPGEGEPILASCQDGWTTVQKRYDGSVNFNRNWNEYSNGFGSSTGEHWLGNRNLHALTKDNCTKLQINMKDIYGKYWQANYDDFRVGDYSVGFKLTVEKYHGNASDALDYQNLMEFSTIDNDRDISNTHCASNYEGGWWFSHCQHANLNGRYNLGLTWFDSSRNEWIAVATSEMRVKRRENC